MLVLTRRRDESIMIGDEIEIKVIQARGDKVKLGIIAPSSIAVHRKEIYLAIKQANIEASMSDEKTIDVVKDADKFLKTKITSEEEKRKKKKQDE